MSANHETPKLTLSNTPKDQSADRELLDVIIRRPGLSKYELAGVVKWSMRKTNEAIARLLERRLAYLMVLERDGGRVNLVYPEGYVEPSYISVNATHVPSGVVSAVVYALNSFTIGVSWKGNDDWEKVSFKTGCVALRALNGEFVFDLPSEFKWFYGFNHRHHVVSLMDDGLLITVSGEIRKI